MQPLAGIDVFTVRDSFVVAALIGGLLLTPTSHSQSCELPAIPDATITAAQDRDRMMCRLGLTFPLLPPRLEDPNRPVNAWPVNAANPEGNWTDPLGHTVVRTNFGLWHTYDSDAGVSGGAMSGFGDYGPFSNPRYTDIDLLKMKDGVPVESAKDWWLKRRPEIFSLVQQRFYGQPIDPNIPGCRHELSLSRENVYRHRRYFQLSSVAEYAGGDGDVPIPRCDRPQVSGSRHVWRRRRAIPIHRCS